MYCTHAAARRYPTRPWQSPVGWEYLGPTFLARVVRPPGPYGTPVSRKIRPPDPAPRPQDVPLRLVGAEERVRGG